MAWEFVLDDAGRQWAVERNAMYALVRDHVRAVETRRRAIRTSVSEGLLLPTLHNVEIDYNGLRDAVDEESRRWWSHTQNRITRMRGEDFFEELVSLRKEAREKTDEVAQMQREAMRDTQLSINSTVDHLEAGKKVLEFVRDLSATTLVVGAGIISGGAGFAVLGAGAGLKGVSKFQDTGNVGAAVLEGTSNIIVGGIGIAGAGAQGGAKTLLFIGSMMDGTMDGVKALVDGKSGQTALMTGFAKFGIGLLGGRLKIDKLGLWAQVAISQTVDLGLGMMAPSDKLGPPPPVQGSVTYARGPGPDADYISQNVLNDPNKVGAALFSSPMKMSTMRMSTLRQVVPRR